MKKVGAFLRSMRFGMILLLLLLVLCFAGSMIPQDRAAQEYAARYGESAAQWITALGLDHIFSSWYFFTIGGALCLNLIFCSLVRFPSTRQAGKKLLAKAEAAPLDAPLTEEGHSALVAWLSHKHFHKLERGDRVLYYHRMFGFYGSFLMHLSILLVLLVGGLVLGGAQVTDQSIMPGQAMTLDDGTTVHVESFRINDADGNLDYMSELRVTLPDGKESPVTEVRVNEPLRFGQYKFYQQTYGTAGSVTITNNATGGSDALPITEACFLTLDGQNGLYYQALYPGYIDAGNGNITLITSTSGVYADPVYDIKLIENGTSTPLLAFPGDELTVGGVTFRFEQPIAYPGLRIKLLPAWMLGLMYAVFALMVAALFLCFFFTPLCIAVEPTGYAIVSPKPQTGLLLELEALLGVPTKEE